MTSAPGLACRSVNELSCKPQRRARVLTMPFPSPQGKLPLVCGVFLLSSSCRTPLSSHSWGTTETRSASYNGKLAGMAGGYGDIPLGFPFEIVLWSETKNSNQRDHWKEEKLHERHSETYTYLRGPPPCPLKPSEGSLESAWQLESLSSSSLSLQPCPDSS